MSQPVRRPATYQDVLDAPEHLVAELISGELYTHPRPAPSHATTASVLGMDLGGPFHRGRGGPGGWWILDEPELHLHEDVLVPDIAGWRRERMPEQPRTAYYEIVPDWVCEVLSTSNARYDQQTKAPFYASVGVPWLWMVDTRSRFIEVRRLVQSKWVVEAVFSEESEARMPPFEAIAVPLHRLWV